MPTDLKIKICGLRSVSDAECAIDAGADLLGFNLIPSSPRFVEVTDLERLLTELRRSRPQSSVEFVGVVADRDVETLWRLLQTGLHSLQLHGAEPPTTLADFGKRAFKALRIGDENDVARASAFPGSRILVDAKVEGLLGGTGASFDWRLVRSLARERELLLAGGLNPDNVAEAVGCVRPWGVDVASGVERSPGVKEPKLMEQFVRNAKRA